MTVPEVEVSFWIILLGIPLLVVVMVGEVYLAIKLGVIIGHALARRRIEKEGDGWLRGEDEEETTFRNRRTTKHDGHSRRT